MSNINSKEINVHVLDKNHVDTVIISEDYHVFPGTQVTICCLTLKNGFTVTGECMWTSHEKYNEAAAKNIARLDARYKIWDLENYLLKERLFANTDIKP